MKSMNTREAIQATVKDMISNFLYYDRKADDLLPVGSIESAVKAGVITLDEIVALFSSELRSGCSP